MYGWAITLSKSFVRSLKLMTPPNQPHPGPPNTLTPSRLSLRMAPSCVVGSSEPISSRPDFSASSIVAGLLKVRTEISLT